jgi:hypothetical protein
MLVELARQQLEDALACLDALGCHQAAAHADMARNLLLSTGAPTEQVSGLTGPTVDPAVGQARPDGASGSGQADQNMA